MRTNVRLLFLTMLAVFMLFSGFVKTWTQAPDTPLTGKTTQQAFKNVQVLKDIPAEQLVPSMQFVAASLGVECSYCHVEGAFDKDEKKPKLLARKMMLMMFAINKDNFGNERKVTCYSCHRGSTKPLAVPIISNDGPKFESGDATANTSTVSVADLPSVDQVVTKYIQAIGGEAVIARESSRSEKGTITLPGGKRFPAEIFSKTGKRLFIVHLPNGDSMTGYDGNVGWVSFPGRPSRQMSTSEADGARLDADFQSAVDLKRLFHELKVVRVQKIGDEESDVLLGMNPGQQPVEMYFGRQTGLLLRVVRYADSALGLNPTQIDYSNYREDGGTQIAYQWTLARPDSRFTVQINTVQHDPPVEDRVFSKPVENKLSQQE